MKRKRCKNCGKPNPSRPRGLCWPCYYNPAIMSRYPIHPKSVPGILHGEGHLPQTTNAMPGTEEKIQVMMQRAERGEALFHPMDGIRQQEAA